MIRFRKKQSLHVLHLPANIRWVMDATAQAEEEVGISVKKMLITDIGLGEREDPRNIFIRPNYYQSRKSFAYLIHGLKTIIYFFHYIRLLCWADVVHWQYSTRLWDKGRLLSRVDFLLLRLLNKPAVAQFHGSDFRDNALWTKTNPWWPESYGPELLARFEIVGKETQENFAAANFCFALGYGMYPFVKEENLGRTVILERAIVLRKTSTKNRASQSGKNPIRIVHAPSNPSVKGTVYINRAIESIKKDYDIDYVLLTDCNHETVLDELESADIVVDQLICGDYGLFAVEAMNAGVAVVANVNRELRMQYPNDLPIVQADPNTIERTLRELIANPELREKYAQGGPNYVAKMHDYHAVLPKVLEAYLFAANLKNNKKSIIKIQYYLDKVKNEE